MAAFDGAHMGTSGAVGIVASLQIEVVTETLLGLRVHADTAKGEQGLRHAGKITLAALTPALPLGFLTLSALAFGRTLIIELTPLPRVIRVGDGIRAGLEHRQEVSRHSLKERSHGRPAALALIPARVRSPIRVKNLRSALSTWAIVTLE